jgi:predicted dehydrogenase
MFVSDLRNESKVAIAILGCGYMGGSGIAAFQELLKTMEGTGIRLELAFVVEPSLDTFVKILSYCHEEFYTPRCFREWEPAVSYIRDLVREVGCPLIIYDATPAHNHFLVLDSLNSYAVEDGWERVAYLGEKPLFTDPEQIILAREFKLPIFCDLIEAQNPVFRSVRQYIEDERIEVRKLWLWRAGSTGLKKIAKCDRSGVAGGALLDKSPHDFSISVNLLGPKGVSGAVESATTHLYIPTAEAFHPNSISNAVVTVTNGITDSIEPDGEIRLRERLVLPADGLCTAQVNWTVNERAVPAQYLFSWIGITGHPAEDPFRQKLRELGLNLGDYLLENTDVGPRSIPHPLERRSDSDAVNQGVFEVIIQELRIGIIECDDRTIVCNFLGKKGTRSAWAIHHSDNKRERIDEPQGAPSSKPAELSDVFLSVVNHVLGKEDAIFLGMQTSIETHRVMLEAWDRSIASMPVDLDVAFKEAKRAVEGKVRRLVS